MILRILLLCSLPCFISCSPSYKNLDLDQLVIEADMLFVQNAEEIGLLSDFSESLAYLKSLKPQRVFIGKEGLHVTLHKKGVEQSGVLILREGYELAVNSIGVEYQKLSTRVYKWLNRG